MNNMQHLFRLYFVFFFYIFNFNKHVCDCETHINRFTKARKERKKKRKELEKERKERKGVFKDKLEEHGLLLKYF